MVYTQLAETDLTAEDLRLTEDDLPYSEEIPMESDLHLFQMILLIETLRAHYAGRDDVCVSGDMFIYFSPRQVKNEDFRGPDFFVSLDVPARLRKSYVVWQEGKSPNLVIELLSESTADFDKGRKKQIYQDKLRVPEYFWFDPESLEFAGFRLREGVYQPITPDERGRLVSEELGLALALRQGMFRNEEATWLRWETLEGELLPTGEELVEQERQQAQQERQRAHQERQRRQQAEQRLAEMEALLAQYRAQSGEGEKSGGEE